MPLAFFTPGPMEIAIIGAVALLLFGNRLPKVARSVGSSFVQFKKGLSDVEDELGAGREALEEVADTVSKETGEVSATAKRMTK